MSVHKVIKKNHRKYRILFVIFFSLIVVVTALLVIRMGGSSKNSKVTDTAVVRNPKDILKNQDIKSLIKDYSNTSQTNYQDLRNLNGPTWNKGALDKAYFNLIYADKIESFNDVYAMLSFIESAQESGINIDDNSYGITQQKRLDFKARADSLAELTRKRSIQ